MSACSGCSTEMFSTSLTLSSGWVFWVVALPQAHQLGAHTITACPRRTLLGIRSFLTQAQHHGPLISCRFSPLFSLPAKAPGPAAGAPAHHPHHQTAHHEANPPPDTRQVDGLSHRVRCPAETGAVPKVQGLHAGRVWHVPLLQGHEEVWRAGPHEAVLRPPAVLSGEFMASSFAQEPAAAW